ncbi:hypothetical protein IPZ58_13470 [Streptomyces roseoverticillatus]|uniref:hypothetical protein n=1 Tax=Streptomyces roseoverticillatus TaxID=66429 RepID=UPI001F4675CD|nr:hypothetical protein [Streptomyces roseoverticillatus]MCF3102590.1 hypothetical protein [Streptomyces roseoverticillatus]
MAARLTYSNIMAVSLDSLGKAVTDWKAMVAELERLAKDAYGGLLQNSDAARWAGMNADVTKEFVRKTAKEFQDAHIEAQSLWVVLDQAHTDFTALKSNIKAAVSVAQDKAILVREKSDGLVKCEWAQCTVDPPSKDDEEWKAFQESYINSLISEVQEVDAGVTRALQKTHGGDRHDFGHEAYKSLDDARREQTPKEEEDPEYLRPASWGCGPVQPVAEFLSYRSWSNAAFYGLHGDSDKFWYYLEGGTPSYVAGQVSNRFEKFGGGGSHRKPTTVNKIGKIGGKVFGLPASLVATGVDFYCTPPGGGKLPGDTKVLAPKELNRVEYGGGSRSPSGKQPVM